MLTEAGWALAGKLGMPSLELRGGTMPAGEGWTIKTDSYASFVRPLAADDDAELKAIPRKQRAEVRKALDADLTVSIGTDRADRAAHYAVLCRERAQSRYAGLPKTLFTAMLGVCRRRCRLLTVRHRGVPVASVLSLYHEGV